MEKTMDEVKRTVLWLIGEAEKLRANEGEDYGDFIADRALGLAVLLMQMKGITPDDLLDCPDAPEQAAIQDAEPEKDAIELNEEQKKEASWLTWLSMKAAELRKAGTREDVDRAELLKAVGMDVINNIMTAGRKRGECE